MSTPAGPRRWMAGRCGSHAGRMAAGFRRAARPGWHDHADLPPAAIYHDGIIGSGVLLLILVAVAIGTGWLRRRRPRAADTEAGRSGPACTRQEQRQSSSRPVRGSAGPPALLFVTDLAHRDGIKNLMILMPLAAVLVVAGGPVAVAVPVLAIIDNWRPNWRPWIAFGAMLAAGVTAAVARNPATLGSGPFSGTAQIFALLALAAALMPVAGSGPGSADARQRIPAE